MKEFFNKHSTVLLLITASVLFLSSVLIPEWAVAAFTRTIFLTAALFLLWKESGDAIINFVKGALYGEPQAHEKRPVAVSPVPIKREGASNDGGDSTG